MKTLQSFFIGVFFCLSSIAFAQVYTEGNLTVAVVTNGEHDLNTCTTQGSLFYAITKENSFLGDSFQVISLADGMLIAEETNQTGESPWTVMVSNFTISPIVTDDLITNGMANFFGPPTKVLSANDTIYGIDNFFVIPVSNPCQYSMMTGRVYMDSNVDCEYDEEDIPLSSMMVAAALTLSSPVMPSANAYGYTGGSGVYSINVQQTWLQEFTVSLPSYFQFIFPFNECSPLSYTFSTMPLGSVDFSLECSSNVDVKCGMAHFGVIRPEIPFILRPFVNNTGCLPASGVLKLVLDSNVIYSAELSSNPATYIDGDTLMWSYSNLSNLSNGMYWNSFFAGVHLTPNLSVNIGDELCFEVIVNVPEDDIFPDNNSAITCLPVVNSYDPNMKEVEPRGEGESGNIPPFTDQLTYTIHFQNTGNAVAYNIYILDTLDANLDASSLQVFSTSHQMVPEWVDDHIVKFNFRNIYLPDSTSNEPMSHGAVSYTIKLNTPLPVGTEIRNSASIYFDTNLPIVTNTTLNTIAVSVGIDEASIGSFSARVSPNPWQDVTTLTIQSDLSDGKYLLEVFDVFGRKVRSHVVFGNSFTFQREGLHSGLYFYRLTDKRLKTFSGKMLIR